MMNRFRFGFFALAGLLLLAACSSETRRYQLHLDDRTQVTYSEVRKDIKIEGNTLEADLKRRLEVLNVFIEDMMQKYRTMDQQRRRALKPKVDKLNRLINSVRGNLATFKPASEQLTDRQKQQIIDQMQELRATYQDLVTRLGITWH